MKKHSSIFFKITTLAVLLTSMMGGAFAQTPPDQGTHNLTVDTACGSYYWSTNGTTYRASGVYTYPYTNASGYASVDTLRLTVKTLPSVSIVGCDADTNFCLGVNAVFRAVGAATYTWKTSRNPSITLSTVDSLKLIVEQTMDVFVTGTGENGCEVTDSLHVWALNRPDVNIVIYGTDKICPGDTVTLTATGADNYSWNNGLTTQSIVVTEAGDYTVTAGFFGCTNSRTVHLASVALPNITLSADHDAICKGETVTLQANHNTNSNSQLEYAWKVSSGESTGSGDVVGHTSSLTHTPTSTTMYVLRYNLQGHNCFDLAMKTIEVNTAPELSIGGDSVAFDGCEAVLTATPNEIVNGHISYTWYCGNAQISTGYSTIYVRPTTQSHSYYVSAVVTETGCASSAAKDIVVKGNGIAFQKDTCGRKYVWRGVTYEESGDYVADPLCDDYCCHYDTLKLNLRSDRGRSFTVTEWEHYTQEWTNDRGEIIGVGTYNELGLHRYLSPEYEMENGCIARDTLILLLKDNVDIPCFWEAYCVNDETCNPGNDGCVRVRIPEAAMEDCDIYWSDLRNLTTISYEPYVRHLPAGLYNVTVKSKSCPDKEYINKNVLVKGCKHDTLVATISGPTQVSAPACDDLPALAYTIRAKGGLPPYDFGAGYGPDRSVVFHYTPQPGHFVITRTVKDAEGTVVLARLDGFAKVQKCAHDPNEITGPAGYTEEKRFVNATDKMNYTINFENDPDFAMAPASRVKVTYDVPEGQNLASFRLSDFGFGDFVYTVPSNANSYYQRLDMSDSLGVWVDVTAGMDVMNNQLFWIFQSIDPATGAEPVSSQMGFLAINDSLGHGEGYVSFYISPKNNVATGDTVAAEALIVFDDNETIPTNVWTNTFDVVAPSSTLLAEMNELDSLYCTFTFDAQDDPNGSGVKEVEVFVSVNNSSYRSLGSAHPDSSLVYTLENGMHYQFMSIATDNVGNQEAFKAKADTVVNFNTAPMDLVLSNNTFYEYDPHNTIIGILTTADEDMSRPFVYTLVSGEGDDNNALFTIDGDKLKTNASFVCSDLLEYYVRVRTTDFGGLYYEKSFILGEIQQHVTQNTYIGITLCQGDTLDFYGQPLAEGGVYTKTLQTPEGCDSIVTWVVSVGQHSYGIDERVACESFTWINDSTYTESTTTPTFTLTNAAGCDSVVTLHLTINHPIVGIDEQVACETFTWINDSTYTESTTTPIYTIVGGAANGCDSIVTLHLTINHPTTGIDEQVACETFTWINDSIYTVSTTTPTFTIVGGAANGCDSVVTLHLTINQSTTGIDEQVACETFTWINDSTYTESTDTPTISLSNAAGCDSIVTLHLTVNYGTHNVLDTTVCESFTWIDGTGETYTTSGTYTHPYTNNSGCASVDTLYLTVNYGTHNVLDTTVCESYTWTGGTGETYTTSGTYTHPYTNNSGCASVDTLYLTVNYGTHNVLDTTVCESFTWSGGTVETYTTSGTYTHPYTNNSGCASVDTLYLTVNYGTHNVLDTTVYDDYEWHGVVYTVSNTYTYEYTNANGCASVDTLHLTVFHDTYQVYDTTVCESYEWHGIVYTTSGTYTYEYTNTNSNRVIVDTLYLTVNYGIHNAYDTVVCDSYEWHGTTYTTSGTYIYTYENLNANGCANVDTLHLTVNYSTHNVYDTVVCESYVWNSEIYTRTGTYTYAYTNNNGCASVDTLHLTVNYGTHNVYDTVVCESYVWNGETYTQTGTYTYAYTNNSGCASVDTLHLTVNYGTHNVYDTVVCESYVWNGETYTQTGTYTYAYTNNSGCASVDTLHLTVNYGTHNIYDTVVCESYVWNGETYTQTGTYTYAYTNNSGCVSVDTLHLTVNYGTHNVYDTVVCEVYEWHGNTYTISDTYTYEYTNADGCTSVDTLHLTVNYGTHNEFDTVVCDSYEWHGTTYTTSGTYIYTYEEANSDGCGNADILHLTVNYGTHNAYDTVVCESYVWNGETYTQTGTYTYEYTNNSGCASVDTLHLTVNYGTHNAFDTTVCESYVWNGETYTQTGTYTYEYTNNSGCASVDTLHLTVNYGTHNAYDTVVCESYEWNGVTYNQTGTYTYEYTNNSGCTSVDTLHLTVNYGTHNAFDTTVCESYVWNGETYTQTGTYTYEYTNNSGCTSADTLHLTVNYGTHNAFDT
ncbi:MAG: hypothetical protein IKP54_11245, partial [Bacteroidales bacterium]|nr:hypothetical protein [Bacteroidales bacterium]